MIAIKNVDLMLFISLQSVLNIPGDYVRTCPAPGVQNYPNSSLPMCIPMSDWVWYVCCIAVNQKILYHNFFINALVLLYY